MSDPGETRCGIPLKVLLVTSNPPLPTQGGSRQLHHYFVGVPGIEAAVISDCEAARDGPLPAHIVRPGPLFRRLRNTRLSKWAHDAAHFGIGYESRSAHRFARRFGPQVVVIGAETGIAEVGRRIARRLKVPLVGLFMDWPTFAAMGHLWCLKCLGHLFVRRYRSCRLAIAISPEMREALGDHPNCLVSYPCAPTLVAAGRPRPLFRKREGLTLAFAGNLGQWHGAMLAELASVFRERGRHRLRMSGSHPSWDAARADEMRRLGLYCGFLSESAYREFLEEADAFLVVMGFDPRMASIEGTSFKSKFAEYFQHGRPVIVWGPSWCTAVRHAHRERFALPVTSPDPGAVWQGCEALDAHPALATRCVEQGHRFFQIHMRAEVNVAKINSRLHDLVATPVA